jgi:cytochrome c oxidase accessory protein FixG
LAADGGRNAVHPADVSGRFTRARTWLFPVLIAVYAILPWIQINGHPAVFLDIEHRRFYLFGGAFNAQDVWLIFFFVTGLGFALFVITTLWGRVWCGYACPQTVFLEGVFRRVERWIEGPRVVRIRRNAAAVSRDKLIRKIAVHALYVLFAAVVAHIFLSYFVSLERLWAMIAAGPVAHPFAFGFALVTTALFYLNFAWFREQLCLVICPYGRLQSLMTDDDTLVIGYDTGRGEPRGKRSDPAAGDCIDCKRCVVVCPTGIDIRNGLQIDCIGCAACVDACDEIMGKIGRAPGLVRYDSLRGFDGGARRFWRPRLALYAVLGVIGLVVAPNPRAARGPARPAPGRAVPARGRRDPQQLRAAPGQQVRRADAPGAGR